MEVLKKSVRNFLKNFPGLRLTVRKIYSRVKSINYNRVAKKTTINPKLIMFEVFMGRQYACNPKAIYEYMINDSRFDDYRLVWAFRDPKKAETIPALHRAEIVKMKSKEYFRTCCEAAYIITNSNLDNRITKKAGQKFIQTWHGTPLKKLRCDIETESGNANNSLEEIKYRNDVDVIRYDYFISPSKFCTEKFTSAFNLKELRKDNIIIETGYPRNDILINNKLENLKYIKYKYGIDPDKKVILYAPTFRDNRHDGSGYVYDTHLDFDKLRYELGQDYIILFRAHYFVANQFDFDKYKGFVYDMSDLDDINELYLISDILITDYSSVFFDYANLERPILFYMYDLEEYANEIRGFYLDLGVLPGPIVKDEDSLVLEIKKLVNWEIDEKYKLFNKKFNYLDDGNASQRVAEYII